MIQIGPYYKAVVAAVGAAVTAAAAITALLTFAKGVYAPAAAGASVLIGILALAQPVYVFLVANEPLVADVDKALGTAGPVVTAIEHAVAPPGHE